jgi:tetratricopeptide (TPR) repeat protein
VVKLKHPNIVTVYDAGEFEDQPYVVMEYIQGVTLNEYKPDGLERIIEIAKQICAALQHAHEVGIVHRDLKPENVIIEPDGSVRLMDFGLAVSTATRMTEDGMLSGTVFYMSPEQAFGYEVTSQSDLYSLGIILYELTTQQLPFEADDALAVITQHIHSPVVPPRAKNEQIPLPLNDLIVSSKNEQIPIQLNDLILSLMSKDPHDRPKSAIEVLVVLEDPNMLDKDISKGQELSMLDRIVRGRMVGRQTEFEKIRSLWGNVTSGRGQTLLISGEPGIGKTRLLREVITHAEVSGGSTLFGECYAESNAPYNAFAQIIRQALKHNPNSGLELPDAVLDDLLKLTPDLRHLYPDITPNPQLDPETEQLRLFENVVFTCNTIAAESPLLLVVDDAHWGDSGTLAMLHHLIRRTQNLPVMIMATYREVELKESRPFNDLLLELNRQRLGTRLKLERLDRQGTQEMLAAIFAEEITPEFLEGIYRETEGNPFFIEEVCRALIESGALYFEDGQWQRLSIEELEIPQGVQVAVESRLAKLPEEHQETLRMAAILGREFDFEVLLKALDIEEDTLIDALETAEEAQMIQEAGVRGEVRFAFVHALVPSAIVENIRILRRRKLHRNAAAAIREVHPDDYEALAYHYSEAGDDEQALEYYVQAGDRALAAFANQDAEKYYLSALDLVEDKNYEADLLAKLGISLTYQRKYKEALKTWRKAIDIYLGIGESDKVAELYARSARTAWDDGETKEGLQICRQGLSNLGDSPDGPGMARLLAEACRGSYFSGLHQDSAQYGQKALGMAERLDLPIIQVDTLTTLGLFHQQSPEKQIESFERAIEIAETNQFLRQALRAHNNISVISTFSLGDLTKSDQHLNRALEIAQQIRDNENILFLRTNLVYNLLHRGQLKEAEQTRSNLQEIRESLPGLGFGGISFYQLEASVLTYQGHLKQAIKLIQDRIAMERQSGDLQRLKTSFLTIIIICLIAQDLANGESAAKDMIDLADQDTASKSVSRSLLSRILSRKGEIQSSREMIAEARSKGVVTQTHYYDQVFLAWAQADLYVAEKNWDEAWLAFEKLVNLTGERNFYWFSRQAYVDWAEALIARGEPDDTNQARQMLQESLEDFKDMGANGFVRMIEDRLSALARS